MKKNKRTSVCVRALVCESVPARSRNNKMWAAAAAAVVAVVGSRCASLCVSKTRVS